MNAIPLVFNAPKANINVNSVSPINANSIRTNNKLINATQGMNIGGAVGMLGNSGFNNETQLRQEINTSLVALKKEAGTLEGLINEAAQMLVTINNRIATLENDTVKKSDIVDVVQSGNLQPVTSNAVADKISSLDVSSVGGSGKYISAISETDGKINATATDLGNMVPVNSVTSGNMHSVTSGAVYKAVITDKTFYYDSNADRTNVSARADAIKTLLNKDYNNKNVGGVGTIRYTGGYYFTYVWGYRAAVGEHSVLEINPYAGGLLNIWALNNGNYYLVRSI